MAPSIDRVRLEAIEKRKSESYDLVKSRKLTLSKLYFATQLPQLVKYDSEESLKDVYNSLFAFLEKNDLERGYKFDSVTLPEFVPLGTTKKESPIEISHETGESQDEELHDEEPLKESQDSEEHETESVVKDKDEASSEESAGEESEEESEAESEPQRETKVEEVAPSQEPAAKDEEKRIGSEPVIAIQKESSNTVEPAPLVEPKHAPQTQHSQPVKQTVSVSQGSRPQSSEEPPLKKRKKDDTAKRNLFDPFNPDVSQTVHMLMKETLPSKVPDTVPLAELNYVAQTLPLVKLLPVTNKVLTTKAFDTAWNEGKIAVVNSRIEELKRNGAWSLRQHAKFKEPLHTRKTHWDYLLEEAHWMAADFKESHKYKVAMCAMISQAVMDYWIYGKVCCVQTRPPNDLVSKAPNEEIPTEETPVEKVPTDEIINDDVLPQTNLAGETDGDIEMIDAPVKDEQDVTVPDSQPQSSPIKLETVDPVALSGYTPDYGDYQDEGVDLSRILARINPSDEIPTREFLHTDSTDTYVPFKNYISFDELNATDRSLVENLPLYTALGDVTEPVEPLSLVSKTMVPVEDEQFYKVVTKQILDTEPKPLPPKMGLFSQARRPQYLRPPLPPSVKYLEARTPTIWLPEDDKLLVNYINQFSYNWNIISAHLSARANKSYDSNIERRTPWQCFERYIQLNEKFQFTDMRGITAPHAQQWLEQAHKIQTSQKRRISPLGVGWESIQRGHKRLRWASMFDAMRKCMKNRENAPRPNPSVPRKAEAQVPQGTVQKLCQLKYEMDQRMRGERPRSAGPGGIPPGAQSGVAKGVPGVPVGDTGSVTPGSASTPTITSAASTAAATAAATAARRSVQSASPAQTPGVAQAQIHTLISRLRERYPDKSNEEIGRMAGPLLQSLRARYQQQRRSEPEST